MKNRCNFYYHVLHFCKTRDEPLHLFLTGGAGAGKSQVLKVLYNGVVRWYNKQPGGKPDNMYVLLIAPTGKAAYNIKGNTIHSSLCVPVNRGFHYKPLTCDKLNSLRCKFANLKIVFIDEISMVGKGMLRFIDQRLQHIMGSTKVFGGVSVIAVGDLFQLSPVYDGWIFKDLDKSYGPLATILWKEYFQSYELTEIMRQKDDRCFAELLNSLREGKHTKEDLRVLESRTISKSAMSDFVRIFYTNKIFKRI